MSAVLSDAGAGRLEAVAGRCFHCGAALPAHGASDTTIADKARAMCGAGCAGAARTIVNAGWADYYATRTAFAPSVPGPATAGPGMADGADTHASARSGGGTASFLVPEVGCAAGARLVERQLRCLDGVRAATFDAASGQLWVRRDPGACPTAAILGALHAIGFQAQPCAVHGLDTRPAAAGDRLALRLLVAGTALALVVPLAHLAGNAPEPGTARLAQTVAQILAPLCALPALLYSARPLYAGAWRDLRRGVPGMDLPPALGIGMAVLGSAAATVTAAGTAWFDSVVLFIVLLLASRRLELGVRGRAHGVSGLPGTQGAPLRLHERAGQARPRLAQRADRLAAWLAAGAPALGALLLCAWWRTDPGYAWQAACAVLLVSCPRALALATPVALAAASERLLRAGVLAVRPHMLQTFDRVTHIVFDKTALTAGRPVLHLVLPVGALDAAACLGVAAALEADNPHPLAHAIRAAAAATVPQGEHGQPQAQPQAQRVRCMPGQGVEGWVGERYYRLGSAAWVSGVAGGAARATAPAGTTSVWLGNSDGWLARIDLADSLRTEAAEVVRRFRAAGKSVLLLSSDDQQAAQSVATQLGIAGALGGKLPHEKLEHVRRLQLDGAVVAMIVAMVGDGSGDAALLRAADVSFALGRHARPAHQDADCVLLGGGLLALADAADTARRTQRAIRQNLAWAIVYNGLAIPAAALGLLAPWMAASGAAAASALVVLNALRLGRA